MNTLLLTLFGYGYKKPSKINNADYMIDSSKKFADRCAEAEIAIKNEKDPLKKRKMENRLAVGITDFSDL